jgi:glutathione synthase/RimK-type ligase-like ATP-grasp enzyme
MIVGIHPDRIGQESYSERWTVFLEKRGIGVSQLNLLADDALAQAGKCDGVMWRWAHNPRDKQSASRILYTIEHFLGIPVYPQSRTSWHFDEKVAQFYILQAIKAPIPQTWLFWNRDEALCWAHNAPYPVVFKLSVGAGSANVIPVKSKEHAIKLINRAFRHGFFPYKMNAYRHPLMPKSMPELKSLVRRSAEGLRYALLDDYPMLHPLFWKPEYGYLYFQEFLPGNAFDTRVATIGKRAFGFRRLNRLGDFRASGSGLIEYERQKIDICCVEIAFRISSQCGFQTMAYDFLYRKNEPVITEMSYAYADSAVHNCPGYWDDALNWHDGQMWPEEAQVEDFINFIENRKMQQ